jgi:hypothetical protein
VSLVGTARLPLGSEHAVELVPRADIDLGEHLAQVHRVCGGSQLLACLDPATLAARGRGPVR